MKISFCLHDHQPVGNFHHVMEAAYRDCYLPMLEVLEAHDGIRAGLHISGSLMEWMEAAHEEYLDRCADLCRRGRMELLTAGRYEPILPVFRRSDITMQIREFSRHIEAISGERPKGLWLTERVWEPQLASVLAEAEVEWAVVDDVHLKRAGAEGDSLFRPCITEDSGRRLVLLPSNMKMRYMIPFAPVDDVMGELSKYRDGGAELVFYGDDGEKFGVWPGTHTLCYGSGWLHSFFDAVESADWLEVVLPSEAASLTASGPFYVPACSYSEMGEWTVHGSVRKDYEAAGKLLDENGLSGSIDILLSGGFWRNFLSIYSESKQLHGRILSAESMVKESDSSESLHHFWRSQCNCAFWHGVFGGIYLPHLREAVWKEILKAEHSALSALDSLPDVRSADINSDGIDEHLLVSDNLSVVVEPNKGMALSDLAFIREDGEPVPLGHLLSRRQESYHDDLPSSKASGQAGTIHGEMGSKEDGLRSRLVIDRWRRMSCRELALPGHLDFSHWDGCSSDVEAFGMPSEYSVSVSGRSACFSGSLQAGGVSLNKEIELNTERPEIDLRITFRGIPGTRVGTEICLNLMTGTAEDRYYSLGGGEKFLMSHCGCFSGKMLEVVDGWRRLRVKVELSREMDIWTSAMDSVNRSEGGFERVHQGTAFFISLPTGDSGMTDFSVSIMMESIDDPR